MDHFAVWLRRKKANGNMSGTKTSMQWSFLYIRRSTGAMEISLRSRLESLNREGS
ncbi:hypothetical protein F2Q68_00034243 [Brassica cretica]|uniref:Uncharacterized protein n=1 Tax=Brassica cretica TaxID=69181 RepID=A0A8S9HDR4_BRACR|nr:hypothetical protein F2Q68_00034243 [Brassica cretica]